jgi:hypothetical protein
VLDREVAGVAFHVPGVLGNDVLGEQLEAHTPTSVASPISPRERSTPGEGLSETENG